MELDDIKLEILLTLDYQHIMLMCQTNKEFYHYCDKHDLWKKLLERDFPFMEVKNNFRKTYEYVYVEIMKLIKMILNEHQYCVSYEYMDMDQIFVDN